MIDSEYQFVNYRPEHKEEVLNILEHLWSHERSEFAEYFDWKYKNNPASDSVLAIVALYRGKVVGFRGYFANRFVIKGFVDKPVILHPGDTCVHPEHRNKGLSVTMGKLAFQYENQKYPLFMNMTCSAKSLPGYIKMGFQPLEQKVMLNKWSLNPLKLWKNRKTETQKLPFDNIKIQFGRIGDLLISREYLPEQMASIVEQQGYPENKLCLYQDRNFFDWRYDNGHKYIFYFLMKADIAVGYVVLDISKNNQTAKIIDYAQAIDNAIKIILKNIIKSDNFVNISIYTYGVDQQLSQVLLELGFSLYPIWRKFLLGKAFTKENIFPLLIRPTKESFSEQDFVINGLNTLDFNNWLLKPICSDSA